MFFIKITGRTGVFSWIWTGKTWALEALAQDVCGD